MSGQEIISKLPGDVQAVLDSERELPALGDDVQQRLRRRLEMSVGILALGVGTAVAGTSTATAAATTAASTGAAVAKVSVLSKPWVVAAIAFVLGGAAGAGLHAYARKAPLPAPAQVTTVVVERRIEVPVFVSPTVASAKLEAPGSVATAGSPPSVAMAGPPPSVATTVSPAAQSAALAGKPGSSSSSTDTGLAAERSLLEVARTALSRGDSASSLASLDDHAKRFPAGQLTEEREALYVQALARAGRLDEAKARAAKFAKRFPGSMLLPVVEAATE
jgi:hypothetical protein